jgi:hypothetical protein
MSYFRSFQTVHDVKTQRICYPSEINHFFVSPSPFILQAQWAHENSFGSFPSCCDMQSKTTKTNEVVEETVLTKINRCPLENACVTSVTR